MREGGTWVTVAAAAAIAEGEMIAVKVGDKPIALYNVGGQIYATDNVCTHAFAVLTDGWLDGAEIECPLHAGRFDITTGKGLGPPIPSDLKTYEVRILGDDVQINLSDDARPMSNKHGETDK